MKQYIMESMWPAHESEEIPEEERNRFTESIFGTPLRNKETWRWHWQISLISVNEEEEESSPLPNNISLNGSHPTYDKAKDATEKAREEISLAYTKRTEIKGGVPA